MDINIENKINALEVSEAWKNKFKVIAALDKPITYSVMLRNEAVYKKLPLNIKFNIWAFLFGQIYYLIKGMWKKMLTITGISIVTYIVVMILFGERAGSIAFFTVPIGLFTTFANFDYYRTMVLDEDFWF